MKHESIRNGSEAFDCNGYPLPPGYHSKEAVARRAARLAEANRIAEAVWLEHKAEKRAKFIADRAKGEAFIGPRPRRPRRPLADRAQAHIDAGGCSGDICANCKGQGLQYEQYDHGKWTEAACYICAGSGLSH